MKNFLSYLLLVAVAAISIATFLYAPPIMDRIQWISGQSYLRALNWTVVSACILTLTLWALLFYVRETWRIADLQKQELGLHKQPVISFHSRMPEGEEDDCLGEFWTKITNHSNVHATAQFEASISFPDCQEPSRLSNLHPYGEDYAYGGVSTWSLQAGLIFNGALGLRNALKISCDVTLRRRLKDAFIRVDSWVSPYDTKRKFSRAKAQRNPTLFFIWNDRGERWEPKPDGLPIRSQDHTSNGTPGKVGKSI